jgi:hypothetical protein
MLGRDSRTTGLLCKKFSLMLAIKDVTDEHEGCGKRRTCLSRNGSRKLPHALEMTLHKTTATVVTSVIYPLSCGQPILTRAETMKRTSLLLPVFLALAMVASAQNLRFNTFYDAPSFSAKFADEGTAVQYQSQELPSKAGTLTQHLYAQSFNADRGAMIVAYMDSANGWRLEVSLDGMFENLSGTKETGRFNTTLGRLTARGGGATGKLGTGDNTYDSVAYVRAAVDGNRLWTVLFLCTHDIPCSEADANAFFNSVKIK